MTMGCGILFMNGELDWEDRERVKKVGFLSINMKEWMKKHPIWIGVIGFFLLIIIIGSSTPEKNSAPVTENVVSEDVESAIPENPKQELYLVTRVIDGDTIEIETGERVRLICMDTPERGEEGYIEASNYLQGLVLDKEVRLEKDISEIDKYGRLVRYIYVGDLFVNEEMVMKGYAETYPYNPDITKCPQIEEAEEYARNNKLGIWAEDKSRDNSGYECGYNAYNCADFSTHTEAQALFEACGGTAKDIHQLDQDNDGIACESLP